MWRARDRHCRPPAPTLARALDPRRRRWFASSSAAADAFAHVASPAEFTNYSLLSHSRLSAPTHGAPTLMGHSHWGLHMLWTLRATLRFTHSIEADFSLGRMWKIEGNCRGLRPSCGATHLAAGVDAGAYSGEPISTREISTRGRSKAVYQGVARGAPGELTGGPVKAGPPRGPRTGDSLVGRQLSGSALTTPVRCTAADVVPRPWQRARARRTPPARPAPTFRYGAAETRASCSEGYFMCRKKSAMCVEERQLEEPMDRGDVRDAWVACTNGLCERLHEQKHSASCAGALLAVWVQLWADNEPANATLAAELRATGANQAAAIGWREPRHAAATLARLARHAAQLLANSSLTSDALAAHASHAPHTPNVPRAGDATVAQRPKRVPVCYPPPPAPPPPLLRGRRLGDGGGEDPNVHPIAASLVEERLFLEVVA